MRGIRLVLITALGMLRCGSGVATPPAADMTGGPIAAEISTDDGFTFNPPQVTVPLGAAVRWTIRGATAHTVTSGTSSKPGDSPGQLFDEPLRAGQSFVFRFTQPGTQPFFCRFHEAMGMKGSVIVTP